MPDKESLLARLEALDTYLREFARQIIVYLQG
jgi:hypothetical protein